jgi:hypothetical protein
MITLFGKRFLTGFLSGSKSFDKKDLAIGIATDLEYDLAETNSRLGFEFYRLPVQFGGIDIDTSADPVTYTAIYSTTLPTNLAGKINEIAIYPGLRTSLNAFDSKFITDFGSIYSWSPEPTINQDDYRVGNNSLLFESDGSTEKEYISIIEDLDISGYSNFDTLSFSYKANDANLSSVKVRFYSSDVDYYEFNFADHEIGWNVIDLSFASMSSNGSPAKNKISKIGIVVVPLSSETSILVDGLRVNDEDTFDPTYGMVARSVIPEIEKVAGREMLIEYKLDLNFGG